MRQSKLSINWKISSLIPGFSSSYNNLSLAKILNPDKLLIGGMEPCVGTRKAVYKHCPLPFIL